MTMTKEQFEQAVREKCPAPILDEELAGLDKRYEAYKYASDEIFGGQGRYQIRSHESAYRKNYYVHWENRTHTAALKLKM